MASLAETAFGNDRDAIESLAARAAIATNLARHSRGVDRNDFELLCSAYHPDAEVAYGMFNGPARDMAKFLTDAMAGSPVTLHRTSNMAIRVEGERARSESYVIAYMRMPEGDAQVQRLVGGRYLDRHERRDGEWRLAHRTYVMDWNLNVPSREAWAAGSEGLIRGAQGDADPAQAMIARFHAETAKGETGMAADDVAQAIAKQALHDLVVTYSRGVDRGDEALLASVFHPDADVVTGVIDGKGPDYARDIVAMVRANLKSTFHSIANEYYEVSGDRAVGETYVIAHMIDKADQPQETITGGRYLDRFERRDGVWKIAHRTFVYDWNMTQPTTEQAVGMYEELPTRGGFAPDDPSCAFWSDK